MSTTPGTRRHNRKCLTCHDLLTKMLFAVGVLCRRNRRGNNIMKAGVRRQNQDFRPLPDHEVTMADTEHVLPDQGAGETAGQIGAAQVHDTPTALEAYDAFRKQVAREDELIHRRLTWMLTTQGFFFGALAVIDRQGGDAKLVCLLKFWVPILGVAVSASALGANLMAHRVLRMLEREWAASSHRQRLAGFPVMTKGRPSCALWTYFGPSVLLPALIAIAWASIFVRLML